MAADEKKGSTWPWVVGILLLTWWWLRRKKKPSASSSPAPGPGSQSRPTNDPPDVASTGTSILDPPSDPVTGSSLTMAGYAPGEVDALSLNPNNLSQESKDYLNSVNYFSTANNADMGVGLYRTYLNMISGNRQPEQDVLDQIQTALANYHHG